MIQPLNSDLETLAEITYDYDRDSRNREMLFIPEQSAGKAFWVWFSENASLYPPTSVALAPLNNVILHGGGCYGNAMLVAVHAGLPYCEGFMQLESEGWIPHAFNLLSKGDVADYTVAANPEAFEGYDTPIRYVGVIIPPTFIKAQNPQLDHQSMLWNFYLASTETTVTNS